MIEEDPLGATIHVRSFEYGNRFVFAKAVAVVGCRAQTRGDESGGSSHSVSCAMSAAAAAKSSMNSSTTALDVLT